MVVEWPVGCSWNVWSDHRGARIEALKEALARYGTPEIFNSDQGAQFTSTEFTDVLLNAKGKISMDGRGAGSTIG
jgi:transposase InsO family protein